MVTMRDVAKAAEVSVSTVSYALNGTAPLKEETKQRIFSVARELGYDRRHLRNRLTKSFRIPPIAVVLPGASMNDNLYYHFLGETLSGLSIGAGEYGFMVSILFSQPDYTNIDYLDVCKDNQVVGAVVINPKIRDSRMDELIKMRFPLVLIGRSREPQQISVVDMDNEGGAYRATEHLIVLKHKRIGMITPGSSDFQLSVDRLAGYKRALETFGLDVSSELIVEGDLTVNGAQQAMERLLELPDPPTAVFTGNDAQAVGAIRSIRSHGMRVPNDVAIVGFDDASISSVCSPELTTMRVPEKKIGIEAGRMVARRVLGFEPGVEQVTIPTELKVRESCGLRYRNGV
jgi:DNA-binding LacI/PurR family transcriptional regulator